MSVNKIILVGHLGKDPEIKTIPSGAKVASFSMATTERFKDRDGQQQEKTEWHNVVAWDRLADICAEYLHKGKQVYLEGKIQTRKWQDKDGNDRYTTEIIASQMQMLGSKAESESRPVNQPSKQKNTWEAEPNKDDSFPDDNMDDDIPF